MVAEHRIFGSHRYGTTAFYDAFSLQEGTWKLVIHKFARGPWRTELYEIGRDPEELHPVDGEAGAAGALHARPMEWSWAQAAGKSLIELDAETIEHLRSLGYLD